MATILVVGESWVTAATHYKGFDQFSTTTFHAGIDPLREVLEGGGHRVDWMPSHQAAQAFPQDLAGLADVDILILSDVGANTLLLHPDTWLHGRPTPNRLKLIREWTEGGGSLVMCGGYYSFQGFQAGAFYHGSPIEEALPVSISPYDDRVETPEGAEVAVTEASHPILSGIHDPWPLLLGYNRVTVKDAAHVLARVNEDPLLIVGRFGQGKTLAWTSDIGPHWCPNSFVQWAGYDRLWCQAAAWLE